MRVQAVVVDGHDLARLHVAHELRAHGVQRGALRGDRPAGRQAGLRGGQAAQRQRAEAVRVAGGDQGAGGDHGEGEGADGTMEGLLHALRPGAAGGVGDQLGQHLGVAGSDEFHALLGQVVAQPGGVGQVAVVAEHQLAQVGGGEDRLHVGQRVAAGGGVAGVADGDVGRALRAVALQPRERLLVEDLAHQPQSLVQREARAVAGGDSGRLLAAVLQRVQANVGEAGHRVARGVDADHAALLARAVGIEDGQRREVLGGRVPWRVRRHHPRGAWGTAR